MNRKTPSSVRATLLLLLLVIGPLQAQEVFACAMMDTVLYDVCCCEGHDSNEDCVDSACDATLDASEAPCCERSVQISVDGDARQDTPIVKTVEVRSDVDPPSGIVSSIGEIVPPQPRAAVRVFHSIPDIQHSGSDTYLITQRLRI